MDQIIHGHGVTIESEVTIDHLMYLMCYGVTIESVVTIDHSVFYVLQCNNSQW